MKPRRWIFVVSSILAGGLAVLVGPHVGREWQVHVEEQRMAAAEAWGEQFAKPLRSLQGVGSLRIVVPKRYYSDKPPTWFILAVGIVLDDDAEKRLRDALSTATPPKAMRVQINNCYGDAALFEEMTSSGTGDD